MAERDGERCLFRIVAGSGLAADTGIAIEGERGTPDTHVVECIRRAQIGEQRLEALLGAAIVAAEVDHPPLEHGGIPEPAPIERAASQPRRGRRSSASPRGRLTRITAGGLEAQHARLDARMLGQHVTDARHNGLGVVGQGNRQSRHPIDRSLDVGAAMVEAAEACSHAPPAKAQAMMTRVAANAQSPLRVRWTR